MTPQTRRLVAAGLGAVALGLFVFAITGGASRPPLPASEPRPAIPKIDVHVHVPPSMSAGSVALLARHGIELSLNASGGTPDRGLPRQVAASERTGGAIRPYCNLDWRAVELGADGFAAYARDTLQACKAMGAVGLKISKALGLGYLDPDAPRLLPIDDARLDAAFDEAGRLGLPILIHSGDPRAFFDPATPDNERYAELSAHPSWSFHGPIPTEPSIGDWPSWEDVLGQYERRVARHPETTFVGAHFGNAPEDLAFVRRMLDANPRYVVETGARIPEIGRHPAEALRAFFLRYRERILFGTDFQRIPAGFVLGSVGESLHTAADVPGFFGAHWRFFESRDEDFAHPSPIQGDWTIDGIGLPDDVLHDLYHRNAERVFGLEPVTVPGSATNR